jgi:hypothetical protein
VQLTIEKPMAINTRVAPFYAGQKIFATLLCVVFGVWGAYDYWVKIPRQEETFTRYEALHTRVTEIEQQVAKQGGLATSEQKQEHENAKIELLAISPSGAEPVKPSKFNRMTQWVYIACLPMAPIFFILFLNANRQRYALDDDGTLHFQGDKELRSGTWKPADIAEIDMSRWMAKSIATVVHADGRRLKLDAYLHKNLHLIVGAIASRLYPDKWDAEARVAKDAAGDESGDSGDAENEQVSEAAAT